nr:substance-K receptor-like [Cherax quadricarinatus]
MIVAYLGAREHNTMALWSMEATGATNGTTIPITEVWGTTATTLQDFAKSEDNMTQLTHDSEEFPLNSAILNLSVYHYPYRKEIWIPISWRESLKIAAYVLVFLVSLVGNLLVILVVYYNTHMRTTTNRYLVNLAVADLLVTLVCMWVHIVRHLSHPHYVLPTLFCKLDGFVQATSLLASVLTLTMISVGRFVAVMFPLQARTSPSRAQQVIIAVWITSLLLACPTLFYRKAYSVKWLDYTTWHCDEIWPTEMEYDPSTGHNIVTFDTKKLFYTVLIIAFYFLPVGIMFINYSLVVWRLWMKQQPGEQSLPARNTATRARKKVVKMVSVVLLVFVICWTPLQCSMLYTTFVNKEGYVSV